MTQQALLSPETVIQQFKSNGVTHVGYLPDSETNWLYQLMEAESSIDLVPVTREGESIAIAAGILAGGKKPIRNGISYHSVDFFGHGPVAAA